MSEPAISSKLAKPARATRQNPTLDEYLRAHRYAESEAGAGPSASVQRFQAQGARDHHVTKLRKVEGYMTEPANPTTHLYLWRSEALRQYDSGYIFALGSTPDEAREAARLSVDRYIRERYNYWFCGDEHSNQINDDDDKASYEAWKAIFEADIAAEPEICEHGAYLAQGSD